VPSRIYVALGIVAARLLLVSCGYRAANCVEVASTLGLRHYIKD